MTHEEKRLSAREYTSMILSCQLATEFNKSKPNKAIKHTLKAVQNRCESEQIKLVCQQGLKSAYAVGWLSKQLNNIKRIGRDVDLFLKVGAEL